MITKADIVKEYPELQNFESDGKSDYKRVNRIVGSADSRLVWAIVNALTSEARVTASHKRLLALMEE